MDKYEQLKNAVQDLLAELRIDPVCLDAMAGGLSPDYPGIKCHTGWVNPHCKVQLSTAVARKLKAAGIDNGTNAEPGS